MIEKHSYHANKRENMTAGYRKAPLFHLSCKVESKKLEGSSILFMKHFRAIHLTTSKAPCRLDHHPLTRPLACLHQPPSKN